jgi:hypothetical protein
MQGIVLSGNITPNAAEIISRLWVVGVIPFFVGIGLLINGLFVSKRQAEAAKQEPPTRPVTLEEATEPHSLRAADTADFTPPSFSVTEETTRQLRNPGQKQ